MKLSALFVVAAMLSGVSYEAGAASRAAPAHKTQHVVKKAKQHGHSTAVARKSAKARSAAARRAARHPRAVHAKPLTPAQVAQIAREEKIYDGLLPGDGYTVTMDAVPNAEGRTECVQLIKTLLDAPRTSQWKEGRKLRDFSPDIRPGTAIATFVRGHYPQGDTRQGKHAAIFVRATQAGIYVFDQFAGRLQAAERFIPWHNPHDHRLANNASAYSTVRW